jgi:DNA mismatch repair ATPase MutS
MFDFKKLQLDFQTLSELGIMHGEQAGFTIFEHLNKTITPGGSDHLRKTFKNPYSEWEKIVARQEVIKFILRDLENWDLTPFKNIMDRIEMYYYSKSDPVTSNNRFVMAVEGLIYYMKFRSFRKTIQPGVQLTIRFMQLLWKFLEQFSDSGLPGQLQDIKDDITRILSQVSLNRVLRKQQTTDLGVTQTVYYDKLFREKYKADVIHLVSLFYELDVLVSMANAGKEFNLTFPEVVASEEPIIEFEGLYHPLLKDPVSNSTSFSRGKNFLFLTGPNMSGKTTFLKSLGIAVFLAHLGMGVPASSMKLSSFQCIFTSLNTTDNLSMGYSYFFSEVIRIKRAAESLQQYPRSVVIFDELFKGTNVKDAFDGSVLVTEGLMKWKSSVVILSSHLLELERTIRTYPNAFFQHFDSDVIDGKPDFNYGLHDGISRERLGLLILKNEEIEKLLDPDS